MWPCLCYPNNNTSPLSGCTPHSYCLNHKPTKYATASPSHSYVALNANAKDSAAVNGDVAQLPHHQLGLKVCFFQILFFTFTGFFFLLHSLHDIVTHVTTSPTHCSTQTTARTHPRCKNESVGWFCNLRAPPSLQARVSGIIRHMAHPCYKSKSVGPGLSLWSRPRRCKLHRLGLWYVLFIIIYY